MANDKSLCWDKSLDFTQYDRLIKSRAYAPRQHNEGNTETTTSPASEVQVDDKVHVVVPEKVVVGLPKASQLDTRTKELHDVSQERLPASETTQNAEEIAKKNLPDSDVTPSGKLGQGDAGFQAVRLDPPEPEETLRLVSIRQISNIHNVMIGQRWMTLAQVDGWTCLVPPKTFKTGDLVVYVGVDSMIPASDERFGKTCSLQTFEGKLYHRVKTRRLGSAGEKIVVQGYIYPVEKFEPIRNVVNLARWGIQRGDTKNTSDKIVNLALRMVFRNANWAECLGVKKWEETPQASASCSEHPKLGKVPTRLFKKTDITRVEDCPNLFAKLKYLHRTYQESVKMDGASMTVYFVRHNCRRADDLNPLPDPAGPNTVLENGRFGVCSKSVDLNELNSSADTKGDLGYWKTALRLHLPAKLSRLGENIAIQGELCGRGINGNREKVAEGETEFFVFAIFDIDRQKYVNPLRVVDLAAKLGLKHVPVLGYVKIREIAKNHDGLKMRARQRKGEGLVYKCLVDDRSFKVISSTYLLEHNI